MSTQKNNLNQAEILRYGRHFALDGVGIKGQQRLKEAKVLCVGAGGLGSPVLLYLVAAGVGNIGIIDDDKVELTNLQRQVLYTVNDIGISKVEAAKARLEALNPHVNINVYQQRLQPNNAREIIKNYDIVADGTDNFSTRYLVNDACFHLNKPNVYASIFQFEGQCTIFNGNKGPCYRCLYDAPPPPGLIPNCAEGGVFGILPATLGSIQATEVLKLILGIGTTLIGRLQIFDALSMKFREIKIKTNPDCRLCGQQQAFETLPNQVISCQTPIRKPNIVIESLSVKQFAQMQQNGEDYFLLDVRLPYEYEICNLGGHLIPLNELRNRLNEIDNSKPVIVLCKLGGRSYQASGILIESGFKNVFNLKGGIDAWSVEIDPSIPRY